LCFQSLGELGQGKIILLLKPALHLGAGGRIDLRRAAGPSSIWLKGPGAAMQPQQLLDERHAYPKELGHFGLRRRAAFTSLDDFAS
jgi:hypothetical protein